MGNGLFARGGEVSGEVRSLAEARERRERRQQRDTEALVTKRQVAEHFNVVPRTVERWMDRGCPVALRLWGGSGAPRFHISDISAWHESQQG
jgi:hypothetical protein